MANRTFKQSLLSATGTNQNAKWYEDREWFTVTEAAKILMVSRSAVFRWIHEGKVKATFPPMTEGEGNWMVHWSGIANPPNKNPPRATDAREGTKGQM